MDRDRIIIGAGLSGLSAAYHGGGFVYEREDIVGGTCISPKVHGFVFDLGIHVLHTQNAYVLDLLNSRLKCKMRLKRRSAWIYSHSVMTKYPFQVNTFGLPENIKRSCVKGFKEVAKNKIEEPGYENYEEWVYAKFGNGIANNFYLPYSEKFWTISPREMTTDWLNVRVPVPKLREVVEGSRRLYKKEYGPNALFRYPSKSGISEIPESFLSEVKDRIFLKKKAIDLSLKNRTIRFKDNSSVSYKTLISTMPIPELFKTLGDMVPSKVKDAVKGLRCNSILCVNIGIGRPNICDSHWIYYPEENYSFFRISFPGNFCRKLVPLNKSSITAEIAYSDYKPIDKKKIADKVIKDLLKAKIIKIKDKIELIDVRDIKYGYPIYDHDRKKNMEVIENYLKNFDIYLAGRYGRWEYQWMHDAILDGKRAARGVIDK